MKFLPLFLPSLPSSFLREKKKMIKKKIKKSIIQYIIDSIERERERERCVYMQRKKKEGCYVFLLL
jgi:hypothetical protein